MTSLIQISSGVTNRSNGSSRAANPVDRLSHGPHGSLGPFPEEFTGRSSDDAFPISRGSIQRYGDWGCGAAGKEVQAALKNADGTKLVILGTGEGRVPWRRNARGT